MDDQQKEEKNRLLERGFDWTKKDFSAYIAAMEMFGRNDIDNIARSVVGKTEDEVKTYHKIFWKRSKELPNHEKLLASIEKGEQRIQRKIDMQTALDEKMSRYRLPLIQLKFQYGNNKGKSFTEDEDR